MTKTVLVTGAGGFLGSHVVEALFERTDWRVVAVDSFRHNGAVDKMLDGSQRGQCQRFVPLVHDLTVPFSDRQLDQIGSVDWIVNAASRSAVGESIAAPVEFASNNVQLVLTMLELARSRSAQFLQVSTDEVYGPHADVLSSTDYRPSSPYAASKAAQETLCWSYATTYQVPIVVLNSANMFGERQSQLAYIPKIIRALVRGDLIKVHYHGDRPGSRNYVYVRNVAHWIVDELTADDDDRLSVPSHGSDLLRRMPIVGERKLDNLQVAKLVAAELGVPLSYEGVDADQVRPGYDPTYHQLENLDYLPRIGFSAALRATVSWGASYYAEEIP